MLERGCWHVVAFVRDYKPVATCAGRLVQPDRHGRCDFRSPDHGTVTAGRVALVCRIGAAPSPASTAVHNRGC
jgi:hypothetical protein